MCVGSRASVSANFYSKLCYSISCILHRTMPPVVVMQRFQTNDFIYPNVHRLHSSALSSSSSVSSYGTNRRGKNIYIAKNGKINKSINFYENIVSVWIKV